MRIQIQDQESWIWDEKNSSPGSRINITDLQLWYGILSAPFCM
jgi:hypothetical protein